ncbi:hypothetical protein AnigIFM59636_001448 [Aspergillus niger]|uniref:Contig An03c0200, genomic contig n=3 Tax=Aspergillus niger TaxID=5061 RepID=A2QHC6_ASPNC|nr:uncharacterized protein BO96DRAFT_352234 [Aspergillus niger CBS 101883]XP_059600374.1 uncharacterized protein An03g06400 [Aspergillus niger]RDH22956.1 hypothetical protein M747DRAFT_175395 [Aspergillus niger ATCC 13496]PYH50565.1 hypothetical protein BO96DRAFT_352234 [Aspergillus niger CBS 101883]CAK38396.1 unnamed protein product [Aspergillus niger]GJP87972.1 fungal-specific transcription factor domain-domain-containing protein [Aspergillus niger]GKZ97857.1 hypothetical protein AnigIFM596
MPSSRTRNRKERSCPWCSQSFTKEDHLSRHIRTHTKERPFACSVCGKPFSRHDSLLRHARNHGQAIPQQPRLPEQSTSAQIPQVDNAICTTPGLGDVIALNPLQTPPILLDTPPLSLTDQPETGNVPTSTFSSSAGENERLTMLEANGIDPTVDKAHGRVSRHPGPATSPPSGSLGSLGPLDNGLNGSLDYQGYDWTLENMTQIPTWLATDDFDINALNAAIYASTNIPALLQNSATMGPLSDPQQTGESLSDGTEKFEDLVCRHWFTQPEAPGTDHELRDQASRATVDEPYRQSLTERLQYHVPTDPLPSTDFLNMCIQMYFARFNPIFPVVHAPTFRPSTENALLLLSICSIGSLFLGTRHGISCGTRIFETLNKAILASWETYIAKGEPEIRSMSQAALIGQVFGYLSGKPRHLLLIQVFHGTIITWVRRIRVLRSHQSTHEIEKEDIERDPEGAWTKWVAKEEQRRLIAGLAILDSEFADLFNAEPCIRRRSLKSSISDDEIWSAPTAADWSRSLSRKYNSQVRWDSMTKQNSFREYFALDDIAGSVCDARISDNSSVLRSQQSLLQEFHCNHIAHRGSSAGPDNFCLKALWHVTFLSSLVDYDRLELSVGREGHEESQRHVSYTRAWASSRDGCRCAVHAVLIFRSLESLPIAKEPPIHAPRSLHRAILVLYCYLQFRATSDRTGVRQSPLDFPEFKQAGINCERLLAEVNGPGMWGPKPMHSSMLCHCIDLLRRLGHWGLARQQAAMWEIVVYGLSPG